MESDKLFESAKLFKNPIKIQCILEPEDGLILNDIYIAIGENSDLYGSYYKLESDMYGIPETYYFKKYFKIIS